MIKKWCILFTYLAISVSLFGQSSPSAEGRGPSWWVGVGVSTFNPDYGCTTSSPFTCGSRQLLGIAPSFDINHLIQRVGVEGEMRWLEWRGPGSSLHAASYMGGIRVELIRYRRLTANAKVLAGLGHLSAPGTPTQGNYFAFAPGGTLDYRVNRRVAARVDYEYQIWPNFGSSGGGKGGLTPNGFTFGVSYKLFD
jgi:opacity protein-like surface antigen